ncbi:hypothetical protein Tco_0961642 [Tanacetum coccineum]
MECTPSMTITCMYSAKVAYSYAFVASRAQSWVLEDRILHDSGICGMDDDFVSALACLRDKLAQHMSPVEYRTILKYRLMILLFPVDAICPVCRKAYLDSFGNMRFIVKSSHVSSTDTIWLGTSTLRPADVLVFGWVGRKHACVDLIGVFPLVGLSGRGFTVGQAALKAASCKVTKYEKAFVENQHVFIPFVFDTIDMSLGTAKCRWGKVDGVSSMAKRSPAKSGPHVFFGQGIGATVAVSSPATCRWGKV